MIEFYLKACLKPYIEINIEYQKNTKKAFEKDLFELMNNAMFEKTMKNIRKHKDIKLVTTNERGHYFVSEPNTIQLNCLQKIYMQ